jgi:hypothetical protein
VYKCNDRNYEIISTTGSIDAANQSELDRWFEVDNIDLTTPEGIEAVVYSMRSVWDHPERPIRVIIPNEVIIGMAENPETAGLITYLHEMSIPFVKSSNGVQVYLEEMFPVYGVENVQAFLESLGCKVETK